MDGLFASMHIAHADLIGRMIMACVCGAVIGFDREIKERPAGLRTHMLVGLAAAVLTILTFEIVSLTKQLGINNADPLRVIEAVTAGVAFLAAGAIIQSRGKVNGLTTGAGLWATGAFGIASGAGYYLLAILAVVFAFAILTLVHKLEEHALNTKGEKGSAEPSAPAASTATAGARLAEEGPVEDKPG